MFNKKNFIFFTLCMVFATINGIPGNNVRKIISRFDVYKTICGSRLYRITQVDELIHDGLTIPVVAYEEVQKHPKKVIRRTSPFMSIDGPTYIETVEIFMRDKHLHDINCFPILNKCGKCD